VALPGAVAEHARLAGRRMDDPGQHLDQRRLAGPVGADQADDLALADGEADVLDGLAHDGFAHDQRAQRAPQPGLLAVHAEFLAQAADFDHRELQGGRGRPGRARTDERTL